MADELKAIFSLEGQCECDFCTGVKTWDDNWCPRCANVKMLPPKNWVNLDVCEACEKEEGVTPSAA